jgi:hypothetical protein
VRFACILVLLGVGCTSERTLQSLHPILSITPDALDFGAAVQNDEVFSQDVEIQNVGQALMKVDLAAPGDGAFTFAGEPHLELEVDESATVTVSFAPTELRDYASALGVDTNDPDAEHVEIPLTGSGRVPYEPDICVSASGLDFGAVGVGIPSTQFFSVKNCGDADLILGSVTQDGAGVFSMDLDPSGATIRPGEFQTVGVTYLPLLDQGDSGALHLPSNDDDEPVVDVGLTGNGGGDTQYPVADIACPGRVDLLGGFTDVSLNGSASYDPLGYALTYAWSVVRRPLAADTAREVVPADQPVGSLHVDAAGTWEVQLVVTNEIGMPSAPAKCVIDAVPVDQIHVELSWGGPTSDMDLHLADDAPFYDVPGDVSWCNPNPDWGTLGDPADDGHLDVDDAYGFGPEQVGVTIPQDGTYNVRVHFFDDGDDGITTATVSVFLNGVEVWSGAQVMSRNEVWEVGQVNWPAASFGVSSDPLWDAEGTRECNE